MSVCPSCHETWIGSPCLNCGWEDVFSVEEDEDPDEASVFADLDDDLDITDPPLPATAIESRGWSSDPDDRLSAPASAPADDVWTEPLIEHREPESSAVAEVNRAGEPRAAGTGTAVLAGLSRLAASVGPQTIQGRICDVDPPSTERTSLAAHNAAQQLATGCLLAPFKAIGLVLALFFAPLRLLLGASLLRPPGQRGPDEVGVPVHRFVVDDHATGRAVECVLKGELRGGGIRLGEDVIVRGRMSRRSGTLEVIEVVNERTGARTSGTVDPRARNQGLRLAAAFLLVGVALFLLLDACGGVTS